MPSSQEVAEEQLQTAADVSARRSQHTDPNQILNEALNLTDRLLDEDSDHMDVGDAARLAELVDALDNLVANGGALPARWAQKPVPVQT